jgi:hypothetical protein
MLILNVTALISIILIAFGYHYMAVMAMIQRKAYDAFVTESSIFGNRL